MDPETYIERLGQIVAAKKYAHAHAFAAKNHAPLAERFTDDQRAAIRALMATVDAAPSPQPIVPQGGAVAIRTRPDALDLTIFGDPEEKTVAQMQRCLTMPEAAAGVLCADAHYGYSQPVGGVAAYRGAVSVSGVGYDIGCGLKGVRTNLKAADVRADLPRIMDEIARTISFGIGRRNPRPVEHPLFDDPLWEELPWYGRLRDMARAQLGTVGSGNHFVDLLVEPATDDLWVSTHFGSRGLGHKTATGFMNLAGGLGFDDRPRAESMDAAPTLLATDSALGQAYLAAMRLAGAYAYAGRDAVNGEALGILGASATFAVHNHHNFCIAGSEKIPTTKGYRRMRDIQVGDEVYAFDKEDGLIPTRVTAHVATGEKPIYVLTTRNRRVKVSGDHPILTIDVSSAAHPNRPWMTKAQGTLEWKKAHELSIGDVLVCATGYYERQESVGIDAARFLGAFLGDGWIRNAAASKIQGYGVGFAIGGPDDPHTLKYLRLCEHLFPTARWKNNGKGAYGLTCNAKSVYAAICEYGINALSKERVVPAYVFSMSQSEKISFLSGYIDADGSVADSKTSNHGRCHICTASKELAEGMREIAISLGLRITPVRTVVTETNFGPSTSYHCEMDADSATRLDLWHESKKKNLRETIFSKPEGLVQKNMGYLALPERTFGQRIYSISVEDPEEVFDLTVDHPGHAFVCEGVVVHNCWQEEHFGERLQVVRKGATPLAPGQTGFVGGSMADISVVVEGVASEKGAQSLYSAMHGAGRIMSRTRAAGKVKYVRDATGRKQMQRLGGEVTPEMMHEAVRAYGVAVRGAGPDESPFVYRKLADVLAAHAGTLVVRHVLQPIGVVMAGESEVDPYKD